MTLQNKLATHFLQIIIQNEFPRINIVFDVFFKTDYSLSLYHTFYIQHLQTAIFYIIDKRHPFDLILTIPNKMAEFFVNFLYKIIRKKK